MPSLEETNFYTAHGCGGPEVSGLIELQCVTMCLTLLTHKTIMQPPNFQPCWLHGKTDEFQLYHKSLHCKGILCEGSRLMIHETTTCLSCVI